MWSVRAPYGAIHVEQREEEAQRHQRCIDRQRHQQSQILSRKKFPAPHGLGQNAVERAFLNLLVNEAYADEYRHHQSEERNRAEAEIDDHQALDADRNLAYEHRSGHHKQREEDQVVEHAVAH